MNPTRRARVLVLFAAPVLAAHADESDLVGVLARLDTPAARADLAARLKSDPIRTLADTAWHLRDAVPDGDLDGAAGKRIQAELTSLVEAAFADAADPRVYLAAATKDRCTPIVLGVVRGIARLERLTSTTDQGAPDYVGFLRELTTFDDAAEVRVLACEALGRTPLDRATALACVAALDDEDPRVVRAATAALERLAGGRQGDAAAWRAWAARLPGAEARMHELLAALAGDDRRQRQETASALERAIAADPRLALDELVRALEERPLDERAQAIVVDAIAAAMQTADELEPYFEHAYGRQPVVGTAVARGMGQLAVSVARPTAPTDQPPPEHVEHPEAARMRQVLEHLLARPEPSIRAEAARVTPALVAELDATWLELLASALDDPERSVRDAAWRSLRLISKQAFAQSSASWREWWRRGAPEGASGRGL